MQNKIKSSNKVSNVNNPLGMLTKPGDNLSARITDTSRKVIKVETDNSNSKYIATQYSNGTINNKKKIENFLSIKIILPFS